jgi:hypothetical protein
VKITSEKGRNCILVNPWPGKKIMLLRNGKKGETGSGERITFKTSTGETIEIKPI